MYIDGLQEAVLAGTSWEGIMLWMQSNVVHSVRINYKFSIELTSSSYLPLPLGTELEFYGCIKSRKRSVCVIDSFLKELCIYSS